MRYLAVGDVHIDTNNRLDDIKATLSQIVKIATDKKVGKVLFLGDAFTSRRPYPEEYNVMFEWVRCLVNEGIGVVLLRGNHDQQRDASTLDAFEKLRDDDGILRFARVVDTNHIEDGWIFMGHFIIKEAVFGDSDFHLDGAVTVEQLVSRYPEVKIFLMGDIHKPQQVNENPPIYYIGSIDRNNFGERKNEPRVLLIDGDGGKFSVESIPLSVRPMVQVEFDVEKDILSGDIKNMPNNFTGALVKAVISGNEDSLAKVDTQGLRDFFSSAHSLSIHYNVEACQIARSISADVSSDAAVLLERYLEKGHPGMGLGERRKVLDEGRSIIEKMKETA